MFKKSETQNQEIEGLRKQVKELQQSVQWVEKKIR